jgi:hypothetical protein
MAVLCEGISVIVRCDRVVQAFDSFDRYKRIVPNKTLCADNEIARVGFMAPDDPKRFVGRLERQGLRYLMDGSAADIVVIDQLGGPTAPCEWIEFGRVDLGGNRIAAARLLGSRLNEVVTPLSWKFGCSLSETFGFVPTGVEDRSLKFLRHEDGTDVYLNLLNGREVYVGRTSSRDGQPAGRSVPTPFSAR